VPNSLYLHKAKAVNRPAMDYSFLKGAAVGVALAAPVGPVGVLCIRRAIAKSRGEAFVTGLGAALGDTIFGAIGGLGLVVISEFVFQNELVFGLFGAAVLLVVGSITYRTPINLADGSYVDDGLWPDFVSAFTLTITNPWTLAAAISLFASIGAVNTSENPLQAVSLLAGLFIGSALWWLFLALLAGLARGQAARSGFTWLNKMSGGLLLGCGGVVLVTLAYRLL